MAARVSSPPLPPGAPGSPDHRSPTRGCSSKGRAAVLQAAGCRFESDLLHWVGHLVAIPSERQRCSVDHRSPVGSRSHCDGLPARLRVVISRLAYRLPVNFTRGTGKLHNRLRPESPSCVLGTIAVTAWTSHVKLHSCAYDRAALSASLART